MGDDFYYLKDIFDYESVSTIYNYNISYLKCTLKMNINLNPSDEPNQYDVGAKFDRIDFSVIDHNIQLYREYNIINNFHYPSKYIWYFVNVDNKHYDCLTYGFNCFFITYFNSRPTKGTSNKIIKNQLKNNNKDCELLFKHIRFEGKEYNNAKLDPYNGTLNINEFIYQFMIKLTSKRIHY